MSVPFELERARALIDLLAPERLTRICDVGANPIDTTPYSGLLAAGLCDVWGFEPQPEAFEKLTAAAGPHEHYLPNAVGDGKPGELKLCHNSGFTSLLEPNAATLEGLGRYQRGASVVDRVKVKTSKLDTLKALPGFDLLKIDVQGGEQAVFKGATKHLKTALAVITEVAAIPLYVDQPLLDAQCATLAKSGLMLHKFLHFVPVSLKNDFAKRLPRRRYRSQLVDGDAVFVRALLSPADLEVEALKHAAILADGVYNSQDAAVIYLTELARRDVIAEADIHGYIDRLPDVEPMVAEEA